MYLTRYLLTHRLDDTATVLLNTLSGAIDLIDNRFLPLIAHPSALTSESEIYQPLVDRGYLYASRSAEQAEMARMFAEYSTKRPPMTFVVCPTYSCNLRCVYCFEGSLPVEQPRVLSSEEIDAIFDTIDKLTTSEPHIQLFGGEPFLPTTKAAVIRILERAAAGGYPIGAVTNGVNVPEFLPVLIKHRDHLDDFQVTVDGPAAIHDIRRPRAGGQGTFGDIVNSIQLLLDAGMRVRMRVNVDRRNLNYLVELADFVITKGWDKVPGFMALLSPVDDHMGGVVPDRLSENEAAREWFRLRAAHPQLRVFKVDLFRNLDYLMTAVSAGGISYPRFQYCESNNLSSYTFGTDGNLYLCAEAIRDDRNAVGTYYPRFSLNEEAVARWNGRSIMSLEECRKCAVATLCGGGCAVSAASINGSLDKPYCHGALDTIHAYLDSIKGDLLALTGAPVQSPGKPVVYGTPRPEWDTSP